LDEIGVHLEVYKEKSAKEIQRLKEKKVEHHIKKQTKSMNPIQALMFRENCLRELQEKEEKQTPDLEKVLAEKLMNDYLKDVDEEVKLKKTMKWKYFKKLGKHKKLNTIKRMVEKWLGREKSDIREKIEERRQQIIRKLQGHQKLLKEMKDIQTKNERDVRFLPHLDEAIEKNRILRIVNYKNHINKILEKRLDIYWRRMVKENKTGKKRIQRIIKEANYERGEIMKEQTEFQEIMGLYGQEAYLQQGKDPIKVMDIIFEAWEDIRKPGLKFFKESMFKEIETSFAYHLLEEIITMCEEKFTEEGIDEEEVTEKRIEMLYDYYCWNLKLISTEKFFTNIKKFEKFAYSTGLIMDEEKVT
jgi:hypothetical protein